MTQLRHIFGNGIRFDTQVQYMVVEPNWRRYRKLPCQHLGLENASKNGLLCLAQCVAVLCKIPFDKATALVLAIGMNDVQQLVGAAAITMGEAHIKMDFANTGQVSRIGDAACLAMEAAQMCLVKFSTSTTTRWATVMGVEVEDGTNHVRALLLLDPEACAPWGTGHNARLELGNVAGKAVRASPGYGLNYRYLYGNAWAAQLNGLLTLSM